MKLIFIHGSGGSTESFYYQSQYFSDSEAIELPGHPGGELCPTIEGYVAWLQQTIRQRGYKDVILVGHSLGSGIALLYALDHPQNLAGIITLGGGARLRVHPKYLAQLERALEVPSEADDFIKGGRERIAPDLAEVLEQRAEENGPAAFLNDMNACDKFDIMDRLDEIHLPVLALCGGDDVMTPPKYSEFLADRIAGAQAVVIPGGTHMVFAEEPDAVNAAIEKFLIDHNLRPG